MPRSVKEFEDEVETRSGRRTRASFRLVRCGARKVRTTLNYYDNSSSESMASDTLETRTRCEVEQKTVETMGSSRSRNPLSPLDINTANDSRLKRSSGKHANKLTNKEKQKLIDDAKENTLKNQPKVLVEKTEMIAHPIKITLTSPSNKENNIPYCKDREKTSSTQCRRLPLSNLPEKSINMMLEETEIEKRVIKLNDDKLVLITKELKSDEELKRQSVAGNLGISWVPMEVDAHDDKSSDVFVMQSKKSGDEASEIVSEKASEIDLLGKRGRTCSSAARRSIITKRDSWKLLLDPDTSTDEENEAEEDERKRKTSEFEDRSKELRESVDEINNSLSQRSEDEVEVDLKKSVESSEDEVEGKRTSKLEEDSNKLRKSLTRQSTAQAEVKSDELSEDEAKSDEVGRETSEVEESGISDDEKTLKIHNKKRKLWNKTASPIILAMNHKVSEEEETSDEVDDPKSPGEAEKRGNSFEELMRTPKKRDFLKNATVDLIRDKLGSETEDDDEDLDDFLDEFHIVTEFEEKKPTDSAEENELNLSLKILDNQKIDEESVKPSKLDKFNEKYMRRQTMMGDDVDLVDLRMLKEKLNESLPSLKIEEENSKMPMRKVKLIEENKSKKHGVSLVTEGSLKRSREEIFENMSGELLRPTKRRRIVNPFLSSRRIFDDYDDKPENMENVGEFIPVSLSGSTTQFKVVNLKKLKDRKLSDLKKKRDKKLVYSKKKRDKKLVYLKKKRDRKFVYLERRNDEGLKAKMVQKRAMIVFFIFFLASFEIWVNYEDPSFNLIPFVMPEKSNSNNSVI